MDHWNFGIVWNLEFEILEIQNMVCCKGMQVSRFQQTVLDYYDAHGRHDLPWRQASADGAYNPYHILVSEIMLQQTQVPRVIPKFISFVQQFPTFQALAAAPLAAVLTAWNGLGYNRRAKFLWQAAGRVVHDHGGALPDTLAELVTLPGIGHNTAGAVLAYAYNKPVVFVETNVRTVFLYHFFAGEEQVSDKQIADKVAQTLPNNAREWYWAVMDYGTYLKQTVGNLNTQSKHYAKQSAFYGSRRQIRGQVLRLLTGGPRSFASLQAQIADERLASVLDDLEREELIHKRHSSYVLAGV